MKKTVGDYIRPFVPAVVFAALLKITGTIADLSLPYFTSLIIDEGVARADLPAVMRYGILMLIISVAGMCVTLWGHHNAAQISQNFARELRDGMFAHIQSFSLKELEQISSSSLIIRITNDVHHVQHLLLMTMRMFVRTPVLAIGGSVMAFLLDAKLSAILLLLLPFLWVVMQYTMKKTKPIYKRLQTNLDRLTVVLQENLTGVRVIKAFGRSDYERERFRKQSEVVRDTELSAGLVLAAVNPIITLLMNLAVVAVVWFGGLRVQVGGMQTGQILAYINYLTMIMNSFMNISKIFSMYTRSAASTARINQVLQTETGIKDPASVTKQQPDAPVVSFEQVTFTYPGDQTPSLQDITFSVQKGQTLAIIGPTGCGKSTLVNLLLRFYDPDSGTVKLNGASLRELPVQTVRQTVSAVLQKAVLFSGTIEENLRWSKADASEEELQKSADVAQISGFIATLPERYKTELTQGGSNLSGGQKQRISIARAVLKPADVLVLDDSSSALDFATDLKLRQALRTSLKEKTVLLIAQRISSVMQADKILVMDKGRVAGFGTHAQLMESCPLYQEIYHSQIGEEAVLHGRYVCD